MKPSNFFIERQGVTISWAQAITLDRLTGAATGRTPTAPHEISRSSVESRAIIVDVHNGGLQKYAISRDGGFSKAPDVR